MRMDDVDLPPCKLCGGLAETAIFEGALPVLPVRAIIRCANGDQRIDVESLDMSQTREAEDAAMQLAMCRWRILNKPDGQPAMNLKEGRLMKAEQAIAVNRNMARRNLRMALDMHGFPDLAAPAGWGLFDDDRPYLLDRLKDKGSSGERFYARIQSGEFDALWR